MPQFLRITAILAPLARLERTTSRLGGGPSILVRYRGICWIYTRTEDGLLILRRRTLYPGEVRGHEPKYFTPFVRACQLRKTAQASCAEASHQKPPPSWTPGGGAEHRRRAAYPFRRLCYTISWDNWEEGFVKKHNFRQSHQIYYLYLQHKSSKIFRINAYRNALCILFFL